MQKRFNTCGVWTFIYSLARKIIKTARSVVMKLSGQYLYKEIYEKSPF
jgi:hypothetical protein